ncbi:MAG: leucine-rich repeat domain-containing protein [Muribaculaceae bacterium]|nr:leucine-rich repeat domain-containing protein [Muribaculaceae bacterium]
MKKFLLLTLSFLLTLPAFAQSFSYEYQGHSLVYTILNENEKTCEVIRANIMDTGDFIIPPVAVYNSLEYKVVSIGSNAFSRCRKITSVVIPNSVTSIGDYAFDDCTGLNSVEIPKTVV